MSVHDRRQEEGTDLPTNGETTPEFIPKQWAEQGRHPNVDDGETRYYATRYTIEHELADDPDVLAGRSEGRGETVRVHVQYVRGDAQRAAERSFPARVEDTGNGTRVEPKALRVGAWPASIAVDGLEDLRSIERTPELTTALEALHGITEGDS